MADQWAYKLIILRYQGTEQIEYLYRINEYDLIQQNKDIMAAQGWEEYAQYTYNNGWYLVGEGQLVPPPQPEE